MNLAGFPPPVGNGRCPATPSREHWNGHALRGKVERQA